MKYEMTKVQAVDIYNSIATSYFLKQDYGMAFQAYERLYKVVDEIEKTPDLVALYTMALHNAGMCQYHLGLDREGEKNIKRAIRAAKTGFENDTLRKVIYQLYLQTFYISLAKIQLEHNNNNGACISFKQALQYGNDEAKKFIKRYCEK